MKAGKKKPLLQCEALHRFLVARGEPVEFAEIVEMLNSSAATAINNTSPTQSEYMLSAHRVVRRAMKQFGMTMQVHKHPESKIKRLYSAGNPPSTPHKLIDAIDKAIERARKAGYAFCTRNDDGWLEVRKGLDYLHLVDLKTNR